MSKGQFDSLLFGESLNALKARSLMCLYLKEKEPFPEIVEYLEYLKRETPIQLKVYNSTKDVDADFIKNVSPWF